MNDQASPQIPIAGYDSRYWARMTHENASSSEAASRERLLRVARAYERIAEYVEATKTRAE
jgi:hypothetical protein